MMDMYLNYADEDSSNSSRSISVDGLGRADGEDWEGEDGGMNELGAYYTQLIANGDIAYSDDYDDEAEGGITRDVMNNPEVLRNTMRNTHPTEDSPTARSELEPSRRKGSRQAEDHHVHFLHGSPVPISGKNSAAENGDLPAWDMPVSPMDKTFRSRMGGPLGTSAAAPPLDLGDSGSGSEDESSSNTSSSSSSPNISDSDSQGRAYDMPEAGVDSGSEAEEEAEEGDLMRFLQLERAIFAVISPYMSTSPSGKSNGAPAAVVFSRELLRNISKAAVQFIIPSSTDAAGSSLVDRSTEGVYAVLRMFEGADVSDSYRLLMDLLKSVLEELITAEDNLDNSSNPRVVGYDKRGLPKPDKRGLPKPHSPPQKQEQQQKSKSAASSKLLGARAPPLPGDAAIPAEWTHPLIADLLRQNPSLRDYVKSRTDADVQAAGFEKPVSTSDVKASTTTATTFVMPTADAYSENARKLYTLSSSSPSEADSEADSEEQEQEQASRATASTVDSVCTSPSESESLDSGSDSGSDSASDSDSESDSGNDGDDNADNGSDIEYEEDVDPLAKLMRTSEASTDVNTASPAKVHSPPRGKAGPGRGGDSWPEATVAVGAAVGSPQRSPGARPAPRTPPSRGFPSGAALESTTAADYSDEEVLNEFQSRVARSPNGALLTSRSGGSSGSGGHHRVMSDDANVDLTTTSPKLKAEVRRRRKHSNVVHDDSSSAGDKTDEERRELHKNAPYDDSSSADDDTESEFRRRAKHDTLPYDDSTSAGGRTEEEERKRRHDHLSYDDSSSAGEQAEEEERRARHRNVPYDDSSAASNAGTGGGLDGSDEDTVDSDAVVANAALATAAKDWSAVNEEELIRRKYRAEAYLHSSNSGSAGNGTAGTGTAEEEEEESTSKRFMTEDDDDYDFASAVVKYWDQLLGVPDGEAEAEAGSAPGAADEDAALRLARAAGVGAGEVPEVDSHSPSDSLGGKSPEGGHNRSRDEASYEEFQRMGQEEREQYLYGAIDRSSGDMDMLGMGHGAEASMVADDLNLWREMDRMSNLGGSGGAKKSGPGGRAAGAGAGGAEKTATQRDYATLRQEIFELSTALGISPSEVLLNGGAAAVGALAPGQRPPPQRRPETAPSSERSKKSIGGMGDGFAGGNSCGAGDEGVTDQILAGFMNGLNVSGGGASGIRVDKGTKLFPAGAKAATKTGGSKKRTAEGAGVGAATKKKKQAGGASRPRTAGGAGGSTAAAATKKSAPQHSAAGVYYSASVPVPKSKKTTKKKKKAHVAADACPLSPSLLRPTESFTKSAPKGDKSKRAKSMVTASLSKSISNRGKRGVSGKDKKSTRSAEDFLSGPAPAGSVHFVSVQRKSVDAEAEAETVPARYSSSPDLFLQSPGPRFKGGGGGGGGRPSSAPSRRMTRRVVAGRQSLNDTADVVVVNNTPIYPTRYTLRPSSAPPARRSNPERATSPTLRGGRGSGRPSTSGRDAARSSRVGRSLATESLSKPRSASAQRQLSVSSSLAAPTMASISRTNDILTRALDFMNEPRPRHPWDTFKATPRGVWSGAGSPRKKNSK
jgi:hypothetical protein